MKRSIEDALHACGRDRVHHRDCTGCGVEHQHRAGVAIRFDPGVQIVAPDGTTKFLVREADTLDEAGYLAASAFAERLREISRDLLAWADRIERPLKRVP